MFHGLSTNALVALWIALYMTGADDIWSAINLELVQRMGKEEYLNFTKQNKITATERS